MLAENSCSNKIEVKSVILCEYIYSYEKVLGVQLVNTCVGVSRELFFFNFPSRPIGVYFLAFAQAAKNQYELKGRIINGEGKEVASSEDHIEIPQELPDDINIELNIVISFKNVVFPNPDIYSFQIIINSDMIYSYDFPVLMVQRSDYSPEQIKHILDDPETIKHSSIEIKCDCGRTKIFSASLDPSQQKEEERLPTSDVYICETCGQNHDLTEIKSNLKFYLGTKNIIDSINRNLYESRVLARCGFFSNALVIQVSAFEAFMRDSFISRHENWFMHHLNSHHNEQNTKKEILKTVKELNLKDEFYDQLMFLTNKKFDTPKDEIIYYNRILKILLFGESEDNQHTINRISFQQIKGTLGGFWAYKRFFGIDIKLELEKQRKKYYEDLLEYFVLRHKAIHASSRYNMNKFEITPEMLQKNQEIILFVRNLLNEKLMQIKKNSHENYISAASKD